MKDQAAIYDILKTILTLQIDLLQRKAAFYILNTCLFCIYEYNPRMIDWLERK